MRLSIRLCVPVVLGSQNFQVVSLNCNDDVSALGYRLMINKGPVFIELRLLACCCGAGKHLQLQNVLKCSVVSTPASSYVELYNYYTSFLFPS